MYLSATNLELNTSEVYITSYNEEVYKTTDGKGVVLKSAYDRMGRDCTYYGLNYNYKLKKGLKLKVN